MDVIAAVQQNSPKLAESLLGGNHPARQLHIPVPLVAEYPIKRTMNRKDTCLFWPGLLKEQVNPLYLHFPS